MHPYRTHTCNELSSANVGETVRLSGWIYHSREHSNVLFFDLRDHYGVTQVVIHPDRAFAEEWSKLKKESVITVTGVVEARAEAANTQLATGEIELAVDQIDIQSAVDELPLYIGGEEDGPEELRLRYRFLDLRRDRMHKNIMLRSKVINSLRARMISEGFNEFQTPILTCSSPEGARDYLVPSRLHPGQFYALPQAPQQFKQLLMVSGFDRYFQIAPCFRDEDARADRSPGEFYQLDIEMSFVTQDQLFDVVERVLHDVFVEFSDKKITGTPFPRIPYAEAMAKYGSDKPDLRIPIEIRDLSDVFKESEFNAFRSVVEKGGVVRAVPVKGISDKPRSFFDKMVTFAQSVGSKGLAYLVWTEEGIKGPILKFLSEADQARIAERCDVGVGDVVFFVSDKEKAAARIAGDVRHKLGRDLKLTDDNEFRFCWIVDYPMYELDEDTNKVEFSHNPFSMPQGGMDALQTDDPMTVLAYQYDIVCNGYELSSGAIRNHQPDVMYKAFELAGYSAEDVDREFGGMINAFKCGAPPHGGIAPGIDRIVMLLCGEENIREVIAFPMNQRAQDLLMNAPSDVSPSQLKDLHIKLDLPVEQPAPNDEA